MEKVEKNRSHTTSLQKELTKALGKKVYCYICAGKEVQELFETLEDPGSPADAAEINADEYQKAIRTLDAPFSAQLNEQYERHILGIWNRIKERRSINLLLDYDGKLYLE